MSERARILLRSSTVSRADEANLLCRALGLGLARSGEVRGLLEACGGLRGLSFAGSEAMAAALEPRTRRQLESILALARQLYRQPKPRHVIEHPDAVVRWLGPRLEACPVETFWVVSLDARGRALAAACVSKGTLTTCLVHPREVFAAAIRARAASVIVVHNHPSGDPEPSPEDLELTDRLFEAGRILGIPLLDHIVLGRGGHRSLGLPQRSAARLGAPARRG